MQNMQNQTNQTKSTYPWREVTWFFESLIWLKQSTPESLVPLAMFFLPKQRKRWIYLNIVCYSSLSEVKSHCDNLLKNLEYSQAEPEAQSTTNLVENRLKRINDLVNLVFRDACMDEISWSYVWHKAAKGGSHHFGLSHLSTQRHKSVQNRFGDNDDAITSIVGRKSSIILGFGVSNIDNNLISAEKVLHGRGQFEGSTPMNKFSSCTEMEKGCTGCLSKRYFFDFWLTYTNQSFRMYCP